MWNGVRVGTVTRRTTCGSVLGVFLRVEHWWGVLVPAWRILFDVGLLATIVGGALLTLWMSDIVIWLTRSFTLCSVCSSTLCSGGGSAMRCRASILRTNMVCPFRSMVTIFSWSLADSYLTATHVSMWALCSVAEIILPILILCIPLFQVRNKCGISSGLWTDPGTTCQGHVGPKRPSCLNLCKWLLWCQGVWEGNACGHMVFQASHTPIWLVRCGSNEGGWCNLALGVKIYPTIGWGTRCWLFQGRQWIYFEIWMARSATLILLLCRLTRWSVTCCGVR